MILEFTENVEDLTGGLSGIVLDGDELWVASDELTSVERLTLGGDGVFAGQRSFELDVSRGGPLKLPAVGQKDEDGDEVDQEIDVEGLDISGGYLWLVGSHSVKRKNVSVEKNRKDEDKDNIDRLRKIDEQGNRYLLARVPLVRDEKAGETVLRRESPDGKRTAAQLPGTMTENALTLAIKEKDEDGKTDRHLAPWLQLPGKDNGLDIEGLAVSGHRVFLGLRGPVLRGWAVVLELHPEDGAAGELKLKRIGPKGRAYRRHFLNLGGLGIRSLSLDGSDLLVLAGPTMTHDAPVRVFRWPNGAAEEKETVVWPDEFAGPPLVIPHGDGTDRAEGMALLRGSDPLSALVVYDAPSGKRKVGERGVRADVFRLP
jgi:hypothetical protein